MKVDNAKIEGKNFELDDPMELKGVQLDGANPDLMVENVIEEYLLLGFDDRMIMWLFKNPFYKFTNNIYKSKGEKYIKQIFEKVKAKWIGGIK